MSPTNVETTLITLGFGYLRTSHLKTKDLHPGINCIQFEAPWLAPSQPVTLAYHHTHWVAVRDGHILDTMFDPLKWHTLEQWRPVMDACIAAHRQNTGWHVTHHYAITSKP